MAYVTDHSSFVKQLEEIINSDYHWHWVPVIPDKKALMANCYKNVQKKIKSSGGSVQYGWEVCQNKLMVEGVHHAVWENRNGRLIDVTPRTTKMSRILFIPDDRIVYDGQVVDNVRLNITKSLVVDDLILLAEMDSMIMANTYRIADERVLAGSKETALHQKYRSLGEKVARFAWDGKDQNSPCYCGSGKIYGKCHAEGLEDTIKADLLQLSKRAITLFSLFDKR